MSPPLRLGILATHPIQYFAPLYRRLAQERAVDLTVYFAHKPSAEEQGAGFGVAFHWDIDLTSGYRHVFLRNRAAHPSSNSFSGCDTPEIATIIRRERFDAFLVSGWNVKAFWQAGIACRAAGVPLLVRGDSQLGMGGSRVRQIAKELLYPRFIRRFEACLAVGTRSAEYFRHYGARRIVPSPHFVDNERFAVDADRARPDRRSLRAAWGIAPEAFVPLFAGKLIEKKRPLDLIRAAAGMSRVHLLVAGDGELRAACEAEAKALGVPVAFAGFLNQSEIARAFVAADAIVLPSDRRETWGLVVNEAMAARLPALVSEACGCSPDLIVPGRTGYAFPLGDVRALSELLARLAGDRATTAAMGEGARAHVARFSVEAAAAGVLQAAGVTGGAARKLHPTACSAVQS